MIGYPPWRRAASALKAAGLTMVDPWAEREPR